MSSFVFFCGLFVLCATVFFNVCSSEADHVNICCYSTSPTDYEPKCYPCPTNVYKNALQACVNSTEMPKNITFKAALCMEKNCQIELPTLAPESKQNASPLMSYLNFILSQARSIRSVDNNALDEPDVSGKVHIVKEVHTLVGPREVVFSDPEKELLIECRKRITAKESVFIEVGRKRSSKTVFLFKVKHRRR